MFFKKRVSKEVGESAIVSLSNIGLNDKSREEERIISTFVFSNGIVTPSFIRSCSGD